MQQKYTISQYNAQISAPNKYSSIFNPPVNAAPLIAPIGRFGGFAFLPAPAPPGALDLFKRATFQTIFFKKYQSIKNQLVMKKATQILTTGLAIATMGVGVPTIQETKNDVTIQQQTPTKKAVNNNLQSQQQVINILPGGHLDYKPYDAGTPPKEYGQYLQRIGKQKWIKSKK